MTITIIFWLACHVWWAEGISLIGGWATPLKMVIFHSYVWLEGIPSGKLTVSELENGPVEIVDVPIKIGDFPYWLVVFTIFETTNHFSMESHQCLRP